MKQIRHSTLVRLYGTVELITVLRKYGEDELTGKHIETHIAPGDIVRLPTDNAMSWDGCDSFEVLPNLQSA